MTNAIRQLTAILLAMTLFTGCQALAGKRAGQSAEDAAVARAVKAQLAADKSATLTRIDVDSNQGVVALNGVVDTPAERARAERLARQVNGVDRVVNNLQVQARQ